MDEGEDMPENVVPLRAVKKKKFTPSLRTIGQILREAPELGAGTMFRLNEFSGQLLLMRPIPRPDVAAAGKHEVRDVMDVDITHLIEWLDAHGGGHKISPELVARAVYAEGHRNRFSTAREALDRLPSWDGKYRIDKFFQDVCGAVGHEPGMDELESFKRQRYLAAAARVLFYGIVARILRPGCKLDTVIILEGQQGTFKSTLLRVIAFDREEWFSDSMVADLKNKDARAHLRGKLIVELAEMSQIKGSRIESMKAFLSAQDDKYRPPYGKGEVTYRRQVTFIGTTNDSDYLVDMTGNRRFLPIACGKIDVDKARELMPQIYAEAITAFYKGEPWWLAADIEVLAEAEQRARLTDDPWEKVVQVEIDARHRDAGGRGEVEFWVTSSDVLAAIGVPMERQDNAGQQRAGRLLAKMGGKRGKLPRGEGFPRRGYRFDVRR